MLIVNYNYAIYYVFIILVPYTLGVAEIIKNACHNQIKINL